MTGNVDCVITKGRKFALSTNFCAIAKFPAAVSSVNIGSRICPSLTLVHYKMLLKLKGMSALSASFCALILISLIDNLGNSFSIDCIQHMNKCMAAIERAIGLTNC